MFRESLLQTGYLLDFIHNMEYERKKFFCEFNEQVNTAHTVLLLLLIPFWSCKGWKIIENRVPSNLHFLLTVNNICVNTNFPPLTRSFTSFFYTRKWMFSLSYHFMSIYANFKSPMAQCFLALFSFNFMSSKYTEK